MIKFTGRMLTVLLLLTQAGCALPRLPFQIARSTASSQAPTPTFPGMAWNDRSIFLEGLSAADRGILNELPGASVYFITLDIAQDLVQIAGTETVYYTNRTGIDLDDIKFHLYPNLLGGQMVISSVKIEQQSSSPAYEQANSILDLHLPQPLQNGRTAQIEMSFQVTVPTSLEKSYGILASTQGVLSLAHAYPSVAVRTADGWDTEFPAPWGDILNNETSFYVVQVDAPSNLTIAATGRQVKRQVMGDRIQVTFAAGPARDFYLVGGSSYTKTSRSSGGITFNVYAPPGDEAQADLALTSAAAAIQDFNQRYAPYPYSEFDIVAIPTQALGIEYPGLVAILQDLFALSPSNAAGIQQTLEFTIVHEAAHQWFYNLVGNNQIDQPWLDESLAQFASFQYYSDRYGEAAGQTFKQKYLQGNWDAVNGENIPIGRPVGSYTDQQYLGIIYGRGAFFFMALEERMGAKTFDAFLHDYTADYSWQIANTNEIHDLAEKDCGCDLTKLFQEWVYP